MEDKLLFILVYKRLPLQTMHGLQFGLSSLKPITDPSPDAVLQKALTEWA